LALSRDDDDDDVDDDDDDDDDDDERSDLHNAYNASLRNSVVQTSSVSVFKSSLQILEALPSESNTNPNLKRL